MVLGMAPAFCAGCALPQGEGVADLVLINARVWTGAGTEVEGVAILGERVTATGSTEAIRRWVGTSTKIVDAGGGRVIPGIIDAHAHLVSGGLQLGRLNLRDARSREEFVQSVARAAADAPAGSWVLGGRWSVESWTDPSPPTKAWIDPGSGHTPVFLTRMDGHQGLANSAALALAGINRSSPPDPPGGVIERDAATGEPTGILKDAAMDLVTEHLPPPSQDELYAALLRGMQHANAHGITCLHEMSDAEDLPVLARAHREHRLTLRVRKYVHVDDWRTWIDRAKQFEIRDSWLTVAGFKGYMDGSLGSRTAYMYRPYCDAAPGAKYPFGVLSEMAGPPKELRHMIERADAAGLQSAVHAIGDEANHLLLDSYEAVARKNGVKDRRARIEHAQHVLAEDLPRFAALGVVASMQPYHKADDGRYAEKALGQDRLKGSYAFRSLIRSGATVCFGSDWPVVTCDPFAGLAAAVTSRTLDGAVWIPQESISAEEALRAYTMGGATAGFGEAELGTIEVGKRADLVLLSQDVLSVPPEKIADTKAVLTMVGGRIVHDGR